MRRPYLPLSVMAHVVLLALLYYFGSYQLNPRELEAEITSSLSATSVASTAKRLRDLQTIKQLLEKSADRDAAPESSSQSVAEPRTPQDMVEQARELSEAIDTLDAQIRAEELAKLLDLPEPPPEAEVASTAPPAPDEAAAMRDEAAPAMPGDQGSITQELAAREVAALEARARETLTRRQQHLAAQAHGVPVDGPKAGEGQQGSGNAAASPGRSNGGDSSVRAEIADFIGGGAGIDPKTPTTTYRGMWFFGYGSGEIPPVDVTNLVRGRGRMFGAGGEYANRVYLNTWYIIGPFAGRHGIGLLDNPSYPPEQAVLLDAVYHGKDKRLLRWRYFTAQTYPLVPPDSVEDSVYYGYTEVHVDQACDLTAWIGVDDDVQIYLNDELVWRGGNIDKQWYFDAVFRPGTTLLRDYNRTEAKRVLHFNQGRNKLFFKLSNGPNHSFLSMVLTP